MIVILVATTEEFLLVKENIKGYTIVQTGVGASNVIRTLSCVPLDKQKCQFINIGFAGSNTLPVGTVAEVSQTFRLLDGKVEFFDPLNGLSFNDKGYPCYTSNNFVTENTSQSPVLYDMELNYIAAFPIDLIGAVKIVSDNLDVCEYEKSVDSSSPEVWNEVRRKVEKIIESHQH